MNSNYVIWDSQDLPNVCSLYELVNVEKQYQLCKGVSRASGFPHDAAYTMHPDFPHDTLLADNLINSDMLIVASEKIQLFLQSRSLPAVEYLPVAILDHKGKTASDKYFIVHPIDPIECVDVDKSDLDWGMIDPNSIDEVRKLVLDETRIAAERVLFRPKPFYDIVLVRRDLAQAIDAEGFNGIRWIELDDFRS